MSRLCEVLTQQYLTHVTNCSTCAPLCDTAVAFRVSLHRLTRCLPQDASSKT